MNLNRRSINSHDLSHQLINRPAMNIEPVDETEIAEQINDLLPQSTPGNLIIGNPNRNQLMKT